MEKKREVNKFTCYCVLWIPVVSDRPPKAELTAIPLREIADIRIDNNPVSASFTLRKSTGDIKIKFNEEDDETQLSGTHKYTKKTEEEIWNKDRNKPHVIYLDYIKSTPDGLVAYKYETQATDANSLPFGKQLHISLYKHIESFYQYHDPHTVDFDLQPYCSQVYADIALENNKPLLYYLSQYESKFRDTCDRAEKEYYAQQFRLTGKSGNAHTEKYEWNRRAVNKFVNKGYLLINDLCNSALSESVYYQNLRNSSNYKPDKLPPYVALKDIAASTDIIPDNVSREDIYYRINDTRQSAHLREMNIEQDLKIIAVVKEKNRSLFDAVSLRTNRRLSKAGFLLGGIGVIGILFGIFAPGTPGSNEPGYSRINREILLRSHDRMKDTTIHYLKEELKAIRNELNSNLIQVQNLNNKDMKSMMRMINSKVSNLERKINNMEKKQMIDSAGSK